MTTPFFNENVQKEGRIILAINSIEKHQFSSERSAVSSYDVARSTLRERRAGIKARRDCDANSKRLTKLEELVITNFILDLDSRGFPPRMNDVRDMANNLLSARSAGQVGINWPYKFVKRIPELTTRFNRKYDYQRAKCEDPVIIQAWFDLVNETITKYGILQEDIFNFDETGFQMGVFLSSTLVVTGSEKREQPKQI